MCAINQEQRRLCACKCRQAARCASGSTVPDATDPSHALRPVVISAVPGSQHSAGVSSGSVTIPIEERHVVWSSEQSQLAVAPRVLIAWKSLTSSCARARRFDGPPPLVRAAEPAPDPERGGPMRGDRPNAAADSLIRSSCGGNWHAVAGRVQPIRRRPPREAVPPRAASAALHGREASAPCRQCCVAADHDRGEGRPPCGDRPNNGGSRPHRPCALVFSGRACSVA